MTNLDEFLLKNENKIPSNAVLLIVCNTKSKTQTLSNYRNFSINTEFLSDEELIEITNMAEKLDLPFRIFYDEKDISLNYEELQRHFENEFSNHFKEMNLLFFSQPYIYSDVQFWSEN